MQDPIMSGPSDEKDGRSMSSVTRVKTLIPTTTRVVAEADQMIHRVEVHPPMIFLEAVM